jgi:hypothetical protein
MKKLLTVTFFLMFLLVTKVEASTLWSQTVKDTKSSGGAGDQYLGTGLSGTMNSATFRLRVETTVTGTVTINSAIRCYINSAKDGCINEPLFYYDNDYHLLDSLNSITVPNGDYTALNPLDMDIIFYYPDLALNANYHYVIDIGIPNSGGYHLMGTAVDLEFNNPEYLFNGTAGSGKYGAMEEAYFYIEYFEGLGNSIIFASPPHIDYSIVQDFQNFRYCITPSGTFSNAEVEIQYGTTLNQFTEAGNLLPYWGTSQKCETLPKTNNLIPGDYVARVNLYVDSNPAGQSEIYHFRVISGDATFYPINIGSTNNVPNQQADRCLTGNFIVQGICNLFSPDFVALQTSWSGTEEVLSDKIPFSYFFGIKESFTGITTNNTVFSITIPMAVAGWEQDMVLLNTADSDVKDVLDLGRPYLEAFMWISFGWFALTRVFHLQL